MKQEKYTALVTGASSGIGLELARVIAKDGHDLVLVARSADKLNELSVSLANEYGAKVTVIAKDLSKPGVVQEICTQLQRENIHIDMLVNNAGFGSFGAFHETSWAVEKQMIDVNITALTELTRIFLPAMVNKSYGRVMNVASTAAFQPGPFMAVYFATKAYVLSFSEAIANELKGTGVTVTALCPGATESGFMKAAAMEDSKLFKGKKIPTSLDVAEYGYKAMMKGKTVAIHGTMNYILSNAARFAPRNMVTSIARMMVERAR